MTDIVEWRYFPKIPSDAPTKLAEIVVQAFKNAAGQIDSEIETLKRPDVLERVRLYLEGQPAAPSGFKVERLRKLTEEERGSGKTKWEARRNWKWEWRNRLPLPRVGSSKRSKTYYPDAYHQDEAFAVEVEAGGGAVTGSVFKDLWKASVSGCEFLAIALSKRYGKRAGGYTKAVEDLEVQVASNLLHLPLRGILVIGF